jgi:membrane fusion protein (multidrug efflux system)
VKTQQNALQEARAALSLAKAQELNARNNLSYTVVRSAMNGVAGMIPYHVGALVSSSISEPLVTISDDSEIYAYFSITENQSIDLLQQYGTMSNFIKQTPSVELLMSNGKPYGHLGRIDAVSGIVDDNTGAVRIRATFPNNEHLLHNGGNAQVVISSVQNDCIVIPQSATYELQNRVFVYRIVDGKTKSTPVEVFRLNNGSDYVVTGGLKPGDIIVAEGAGLVKDGVEIKVKK